MKNINIKKKYKMLSNFNIIKVNKSRNLLHRKVMDILIIHKNIKNHKINLIKNGKLLIIHLKINNMAYFLIN